jgi:hypothetical protein
LKALPKSNLHLAIASYGCDTKLGQGWLLFFWCELSTFTTLEILLLVYLSSLITMLTVMHAMMLLWWIEIFVICLLEFCFVLEFIKFIVLWLLDLGGVFWFHYSGLLRMLYVFGATYIGGTKYWCERKLFKAGLQEAKYQFLYCNIVCCVVCF